MGSRLVLGFVLACGCNATLATNNPDGGGGGPSDGSQNQTGSDSGGGGGSDADMFGMWTAPQPVLGASDATINEDDCALNSTETELYFAIPDPLLTNSPKQLWMMTRATKNDAWGSKTRVTALNAATTIESPRLSPDDLTIYFGHNGQIYSSTRTQNGGTWGTPAPVAGVNTAAYEKWMAVCQGGYFMVSRDNGASGQDLYEGQLGQVGTLVASLSSANGSEISTYLSPDCLTVYFASDRSGQTQMYTATRASTNDPWPSPTLVTDFGAATDNEDGFLSSSGHSFYFATRRGNTTKDLYYSTR